MVIKGIVWLLCGFTLIMAQDYQTVIKKFSERIVVVDFTISFEMRGEIVKRNGKTVGIIYDDSKILTTSLIFENETIFSKRLRFAGSAQGTMLTNYKVPKTVKITFKKKEISGEFVQADFEKGIAIIKTEKGTFPFKPIKFQDKELKIGETVSILSLLPIETFEFPQQLVNCNISMELKKQNNKFFHCDKQMGHIAGGIVFNYNLEPIGILSTPISIPESMYDERENFLVSYYGLNSVVILPYTGLKSFLGEGEGKESNLWIGLIPGVFSIYYEEKLKDIIKDGQYKAAINIDKIVPQSPLQNSKIFENDLIVEINGTKVEDIGIKSKIDILVKIASLLKPLEFITFKIYRRTENKYMDVKVVPGSQPTLWEQAQEVMVDELGIKVKELTVDYKVQRKLDFSEEGVVVTGGANVQKEATNKNFILYDIIKRVEKNSIKNIKELKDIISKIKTEGKKVISIEVMRPDENDVWNLKIELK